MKKEQTVRISGDGSQEEGVWPRSARLLALPRLDAKKKPPPCMDFRRGLCARRGCKFSHDGDFGQQAGDGGGNDSGVSLKVSSVL